MYLVLGAIVGKEIKPLYLFLDSEIFLFAKLKGLKFKEAKKNTDKIQVFADEFEKNHPEVKDAAQIGKMIADSFLVAQMYKSACGYEYVEEEWKLDEKTHEMVKVKEKVVHQPANAQLAMFMATNRMPEQFRHKIELTKKGFIIDSTSEVSSDQIERLAGALMDESKRVKQIESTVIDVEFEDKDNAK